MREAQSFYTGLFICPPPQHVWHLSQRSPRASENQPSSLKASLISNPDFFKISQNPPCASGAWRHSHSLASVSHLGLLWHLWVTCPLYVRAWTPVLMLHPTNPCAVPKGSQPNQTQRHKPKSLGYYITREEGKKRKRKFPISVVY